MQTPANALELGGRRLFEARSGLIVVSAGIHHARVEPEAVEIVAEIVVRGDIPAASLAGIAIQPVQRFARGFREVRETALHLTEEIPVPQHDADQRRQVVAAPVILDERFAGADRAAERHFAVELRAQHRYLRGKLRVIAGLAECEVIPSLDDDDLSFLEAFEAGEYDPAREPIDEARFLPAEFRRPDKFGIHRSCTTSLLFFAGWR